MKVQQVLAGALLSASAFAPAQAAPFTDDKSLERRWGWPFSLNGPGWGLGMIGQNTKQTASPKRATTIATTGVTGNGVQVRMELRTMQQQFPDMFNLYLLGLQDFKNVAQSDSLSYYEIAGIHGRPYTAWDGATSNGGANGYGGGYCTHTSNLFLPWHRPYLALYEQQLYQHIQNVAATFTGAAKTRYQAAAVNFRLPYWDWAAAPCSTCNAYPVLVSNQYVTVTTPTGQQTILNPLFRYDFHPISSTDMVYNPFATWNVTKRYPTSWDSNGTSQNWLVAPEIANNRASFSDRLYNLFQNSNFSQFGNEAWITSTTQNADSLESLHDAIHSITGNNGHMTYLDYAGFDPIFFLHHAMIDRCFALYTKLWPNTYVQPMAAVGSTFTYPAGTVEDVNSALVPFHSDTVGTSWTSAQVTDPTKFGYTYPELQNNANAASIRSAISKLYGNTAASSTVTRRDVNDNVGAAKGAQEASTGNGNSYEWACNIVSQKFQMNGSYAVYLFLDAPSDDSSQWSSDPNFCGTHGVFANFADDDNIGMSQMDLKVTASLPLTTSLINKVASGELSSLAPSVVEPYLNTNLHWRIKMFNGVEVAASDVPDLSVTVVGAEVQPAPTESDFPIWGQINAYSNITIGKPGGHSDQYWGSFSFSSSYSTSSSSTSSSWNASFSAGAALSLGEKISKGLKFW